MKKTTYLIILLLLSVRCFRILPFGAVMSDDAFLAAMLLWGIYGVVKFGDMSRRNPLYKSRYLWVAVWMFIAVGLSSITCALFWGQGILQSFITSRSMLGYLMLPILLAIKPNERELLHSIEIFGLINVAIILLDLLSPVPITMAQANFIAEYGVNQGYVNEGKIFGRVGFCSLYVLYPMYYRLQRMKESFNSKDFWISTFWLLVIIVALNRSTLIFATVVYMYCVITSRCKYKFGLIALCSILFFSVYMAMEEYIIYQFDRTTSQIDDEDYARNKAYDYFLYEFSPNIACEIFGNGLISKHTNAHFMETLSEQETNFNDVGFIGMWALYGVIPVIVVVWLMLKTLLSSIFPLYMKLRAIHTLICGATLSFFVEGSALFSFLIFVYLYAYYKENMNRYEYEHA